MSAQNGPKHRISDAMLSDNIGDLLTPGVVVEMDADEAESLGAFAETGLSEKEAWASNLDGDMTDGE